MSVLDGPLVFVDVETTGMSYTRGRVIEVAAVRLEKQTITDRFSSLVDPGINLPEYISGLTGISDYDLRIAPVFAAIADDLHTIMEDAVFVAHNVRFDYSFLKHEFARTGHDFNPRLLCTVRLSKSLYPTARGHKLQDIINRLNIQVSTRHRALDDAMATLQFVQHAATTFPAHQLEAAINHQIKKPTIPKNLNNALVDNLPEKPGVYVFLDSSGSPLYIGKSINIRKRVLDHFRSDHKADSEFKISQQLADIETIVTGGELEALLLESKLIKERQPLLNRQLRRYQKLTLARRYRNSDGYDIISLEETAEIEPTDLSTILGVYSSKCKAQEFLKSQANDFGLCPKLMSLEKTKGSCFWHQLKKCQGACLGKEEANVYNSRLELAFEKSRINEWPYPGPIIVKEHAEPDASHSLVIDQWCVIALISQQPFADPIIQTQPRMFDIDTYKILRTYFRAKAKKLFISPITHQQLNSITAC